MGIRSWFNREAKANVLIELEKAQVERLKAQVEADKQRMELSLREKELELKYSEQITASKIADKKAREEIRIMRREAGMQGAKARKEAKANQGPACAVCENDKSPHLTAYDIQWHHAGHPANFTPNFA